MYVTLTFGEREFLELFKIIVKLLTKIPYI
jgi:hypothetical protein